MWTRRNVTLGALAVVAAPLLAGAAGWAIGGWGGSRKAADLVFSIEMCAAAVLFLILQVNAKFRDRLEIPNADGDEREQLIVMKATRFVFGALSSVLLVSMGWFSLISDSGMTSVPSWSLLYLYLAMQCTYYSSMVYYGRKL